MQLSNYDAVLIRNLNLKYLCSSCTRVGPELVKLQMEKDMHMWKLRFFMHDFSSRRFVSKPYERIDAIATVLCQEAVASLQNVES